MIEFERLDEVSGVSECGVREAGCRLVVKRVCMSCGTQLCDSDKCGSRRPTLYEGIGRFFVCKPCDEKNGKP